MPIQSSDPLQTDVVIIGAGAGGGALSWRLTKAGLKVMLLEAGPKFSPTNDYNLDNSKWESPFPIKPNSQGAYTIGPTQDITSLPTNMRSWNQHKGLLVQSPYRANFGYHHVRGYGGSSLHFTGEAHRLNPKSMNMASNFNVAADWPLKYDELEAYYQIAEQLIGVSGPIKDDRCPRSNPFPTASHPYSNQARTLANAAKSIQLNISPNSLAIASTSYDGRPACNYCGGCQKGCSRQDKGSIDLTYLKHANDTGNLTTLTDCEVSKIVSDGHRVNHVIAHKENRLIKISAKHFVVAAGAIQTPKLLLNSANEHNPTGLANSSGMVGKNFMETLLCTLSAVHPNYQASHKGLPVNWVCWDYNAPDSIPNVVGGCRISPSVAESDLIGPKAYADRVIPGWGLAHKQAMRRDFGKVLSISAIGESIPNDRSYISLSQQKDQYGMPIAEINSYLDDEALKRLAFMLNKCEDILHAAGCAAPFERFSSADAFSSTHVFGTCRMGSSAESSVCDTFGTTHDVNNLHIMDASIFPSSGGGESPGLTIQALAIRSADHLIKTLRS